MRPSTTAAALALLLFAVSSTGFTAHRHGRKLGRIKTKSAGPFFSTLGTQDVDEAEATSKDSSSTSYDPSDAFATDSFGGKTDTREKSVELDSVNDLILDLHGVPLSNEYFEDTMGIPQVDYYTCPEQDTFRGFMSNGCRVHLYPGGETAFYKRVVFETLDHARKKITMAPFKLARDSKSYQVVASFLTSKACQQLMDTTGVHIPKCYDAQLEPNHSSPIDSKFSFLLEDFAPWDGWYQTWLLSTQEECEAALSTYAKIHAYFWQGSNFWKEENAEAAHELEAGVWKSGSYVQPKAQNADQCEKVASEWATKRLKFETELSSLDFWDNLGERLQSVAEECGRLAHPFADVELSDQYMKYRTFTHGDPKQANLFFRHSNDELQVGLIDFQWSGFGLAASDIAHFLTSAVHADLLVNGGEEKLQQYYFDELQKYLVEYGAFDNKEEALEEYSYDIFTNQYDTAVLDLVRLIVAYTWSRFTEPVEKDDKEGCARTMNKTSYNKCVPNVVWLMSRCHEILKSRGV